MTKVLLNITQSIDGFIADATGNRDFSFEAQTANPDFQSFYENVGSIVMGRKTYDSLKEKEPDMFKEKQVYVITHYLRQKEDNVTFIHENIMGHILDLKKQSKKDIWVLGGSEIVNILLKEKLIDEMLLTTAPGFLGTGVRLFSNDNEKQKVKLVGTKNFGNFVQAHYKF